MKINIHEQTLFQLACIKAAVFQNDAVFLQNVFHVQKVHLNQLTVLNLVKQQKVSLQLAAIFLALKQMIKHTQIRPNELD
jgi:hypothetical protein